VPREHLLGQNAHIYNVRRPLGSELNRGAASRIWSLERVPENSCRLSSDVQLGVVPNRCSEGFIEPYGRQDLTRDDLDTLIVASLNEYFLALAGERYDKNIEYTPMIAN
jgi:hypothetical protein